MYYLFIRNKNKLEKYKKELNCVCENIENGKTPVFNEVRFAKTGLIECIPFNSINALFLILVTVLFDKSGGKTVLDKPVYAIHFYLLNNIQLGGNYDRK